MAYDPGMKGFLTGLGYDVCYVAPPPYMTADIQDTLEYIVNAVSVPVLWWLVFVVMG